MNKKTELTKLQKAELAELLAQKTEEFKLLVGQPTLYAPKDPNPKPLKLGAPPVVPENLRDKEWQEYIEQLSAGTYAPDTDYQDPLSMKERRKLDQPQRKSQPAKYGPTWHDQDARGYKVKRKD